MHNHKSREGTSYSSANSSLIFTTSTAPTFTAFTNEWRILPSLEDLLNQRANQEDRFKFLANPELKMKIGTGTI